MVLVAAWAIRGLLQSEPPAVPTPSNSAASGSPLPVVTATVPSVEATATGVASVEPPTPPSSPTPTPTPPPPVVVGAFGELPAPNLPQPAYPPGQLTLQYELGLDLAALPTEAPVYRLTPRQWDDASVSALARSLGLEGPVERTPGGGFLVRSSHGQLVVSDLTIQFQAATPTPTPSPAGDTTATPEATAPPLPLPSDGELLTVARSWLERNRLVTTPLDGGRVRERLPEMGMAIVTFGPAEPEPVLSAVPSATLTVTAEGTIRQAFVAWPAALEPSVYSLRPAETLWTDVQNGRGTLEVDETIFTRASLPLRGTARITSAQLAWVDAGQGSTRYLTPVVRFQGTALFEGYSEPVELSVTVAAVAAQIAPRG
ncbi:MAG: hypothetical protein NZL87_01105 [Thermomicrobium sp.]|nr:hypothetical protein [Thermomicrobium sp.]